MAEDQVKLGPCPLCGGNAYKLEGAYAIICKNEDCSIAWIGFNGDSWQALSALAEQNRRRGEALEKLKKWAGKIGYPDWVKLCEEALK